MLIQEEQFERVILLSMEGECTPEAGRQLLQRMQSLLESEFSQFVLNICGLPRLQPETVDALRSLADLSGANNIRIVIYAEQEPYRQALATLCDANGWPIARTLSEALQLAA